MKSNKELKEKLDKDFTNKIQLSQFIKMLEHWKEDCETRRGKKLSVDMWALNMMTDKLQEIHNNMILLDEEDIMRKVSVKNGKVVW